MKLEEIRKLLEDLSLEPISHKDFYRLFDATEKLVAVAEAAKEIDEGCYGKSGLGEALAALEAE